MDLHSTRDAPKTVPDPRSESGRSPTVIPKGFGKIIRDESGTVVAIELAEEEAESNSAGDGEGLDVAWVEGGETKRLEGGSVIEGE